jgi:hypothetical protein
VSFIFTENRRAKIRGKERRCGEIGQAACWGNLVVEAVEPLGYEMPVKDIHERQTRLSEKTPVARRTKRKESFGRTTDRLLNHL